MSLTLWVMSPRVDQVFFGMVFMWGAGGSDKFRAIVCERAIRPPMRAPDTRIVPTAPTTYLLHCRPLTKSDPRYILFQSFKTGFFVPIWPPELSSFLSSSTFYDCGHTTRTLMSPSPSLWRGCCWILNPAIIEGWIFHSWTAQVILGVTVLSRNPGNVNHTDENHNDDNYTDDNYVYKCQSMSIKKWWSRDRDRI